MVGNYNTSISLWSNEKIGELVRIYDGAVYHDKRSWLAQFDDTAAAEACLQAAGFRPIPNSSYWEKFTPPGKEAK